MQQRGRRLILIYDQIVNNERRLATRSEFTFGAFLDQDDWGLDSAVELRDKLEV